LNLYARVGNGKRVVQHVNIPMVNHYSEYLGRFALMRRLLYPGGGQAKVFYGYGQSIHALVNARKLGAMIRLDSELYLFWALLIIGVLTAAMMPALWGAVLMVAEVALLSIWMGPGTVMRFTCLIIPLVTGWSKYNSGFRPEVRKRVSRLEIPQDS